MFPCFPYVRIRVPHTHSVDTFSEYPRTESVSLDPHDILKDVVSLAPYLDNGILNAIDMTFLEKPFRLASIVVCDLYPQWPTGKLVTFLRLVGLGFQSVTFHIDGLA